MEVKDFRREIRKCGKVEIRMIQFPSPHSWGNLKSDQNTDKISK